MDTKTITLTPAHMKLMEHIALNPDTDTAVSQMPLEKRRLVPGLYACHFITFGTAARNLTHVTATKEGGKAVEAYWADETLTFTVKNYN